MECEKDTKLQTPVISVQGISRRHCGLKLSPIIIFRRSTIRQIRRWKWRWIGYILQKSQKILQGRHCPGNHEEAEEEAVEKAKY